VLEHLELLLQTFKERLTNEQTVMHMPSPVPSTVPVPFTVPSPDILGDPDALALAAAPSLSSNGFDSLCESHGSIRASKRNHGGDSAAPGKKQP